MFLIYILFSLCKVVDKIVMKMIANIMKSLLDSIISPSQSDFIPNRLISNNALIAFKLMHSIRRKTQGKVGIMAIKTDMSKVHDRVKWKFLEQVILKFGFAGA